MRKRAPQFRYIGAICKALDIKPEFLEEVMKNKNSLYQMKKRQIGDKERPIYAAKGNLHTFLRRLHNRLRVTEIDKEFLGGVRGCSVIDNAKRHAGSKYILNLDIQNFFPSVTTSMVRDVFRRELGCTPKMSGLLADICTADNQLPQGFATSPMLSIFTLSAFAQDLRPLLLKHGLRFTFWIDDLTISGGSNPHALIPDIEKLCKKYELHLHPYKRHLGIKGESLQEVTGITINHNSLSPSPGYTRDTADMIHYAEKQGWEFVNDAFDLDCDSEPKFLLCLNGRIAWSERAKEKPEEKLREGLLRLLRAYQERTSLKLPLTLRKLLA